MTAKARNLSSAVILMTVSAYWFVESNSFRTLSQIFPRVLSLVVFALALLLGVLALLGRGPAIKLAEGDAETRHLRSGTLIGAMLLWMVLIPLVGLLAASIVGVVGIGLLTFRAHVGTLRAIVIAVVTVLLFYLLFALLLHVPFPRGMLF